MSTITYEDMTGPHVLSGVWHEILTKEQLSTLYRSQWYDAANSFILLLDGRLWRFTEDPDDGYRSYMREVIEITDVMPVNWWNCSERVYGYYVTKWCGHWDFEHNNNLVGNWWLPDWTPPEPTPTGKWYKAEACSMLVFVSMLTNKPVLIIGTDEGDAYYPSAILRYYPEHMSLNSEPRGFIDVTGRQQWSLNSN